MAVHVVAKACRIEPDCSRGVITLESDLGGGGNFADAIYELEASETRNFALGAAARAGISNPHINGNLSGIYPVNSEGLSLDQVKDEKGEALPARHPRMQPARYRIDVPVSRPIR